jgi:hypothetical protein
VVGKACALQAALHANQRILAESGRGTFRSVTDLKEAIHDYLDRHEMDAEVLPHARVDPL